MNEIAALSKDSAWSSLREEYIEYVFLGELCRAFWRRDVSVDVLRSHTDQSGFDLVLEAGSATRHVQLESSFTLAATRRQGINKRLEGKTGGCVIWILFERESLRIDSYLWFGADDPMNPMPSLGDRPVKHTKGNAQGIKQVRPGMRALNRGDFEPIQTIDELSSRLFPNIPLDIRGNFHG